MKIFVLKYKKINASVKLRFFHLFNHCALVSGLFLYSPLWLLLSFFVWWLIGSLGISIGFHRLLSHKSFRTTSFLGNIFTFIGCLATGGGPVAWVGAHRMHHMHTDKPKDPHSWKEIGALRVYTHYWSPLTIRYSVVRDLLKKPFIVYLQRNYFLIISLWSGTLYLWDPVIGIFAYSAPSVLAFHAFGMINLFGHIHGYRSYNTMDSSTNSWVANLLTFGEGWHNNHHKYPTSYRIGLGRHEYDISAWFLEKFNIISKDNFKTVGVLVDRHSSSYEENMYYEKV